jgi:AcrR family transcriptional regulator
MPLQHATSSIPRRKKSRGRPSIPFLRETILRHAGELFAGRDFVRVSIDEVAARCGIGKGSVYRQFGSKEELYAAVVIEGFKHLQKEIRDAMKDRTSIREQIEVVVRHTLIYFWTRRQFFALLRDPTALPRNLARSYLKQRNELAKMVDAILVAGARRGTLRNDLDTRIVAESLLGMLRGINRYCREYTTPEHATNAVLSLFFEGCLGNTDGSSMSRKS